MSRMFITALQFYKAAQVEKAPKTEPQFFDEQLQAYEFMGFLSTLAHLKNQLHKIRDLHSIFGSVFGVLVRLRPGVIKNAIDEMIKSNSFDKDVYVSLRDGIWKDIQSNNLDQQLKSLVQIIEIELLDDEALAKSSNGAVMNVVKGSAKKAIRVIESGLEYL
jgi:hypothetical protein